MRVIRFVLTTALLLTLQAGGAVMAAAIPADVKKIVAFIYIKDAQGQLQANGTGFFVGVPAEGDPTRVFGYLVTAKHVLRDPQNKFFTSVFLRLDRLAGGTETIELPLRADGTQRNVFVHEDSAVDIAVVPALPDQKLIDFKILPLELITSAEDFPTLHIAEGTEVFFTGLFTPHIGQKRNYPVARFGRVALLSDEKINWGGTLMDLYLVESSSYGGNSGSPVFLYLGADRVPGSLVVGPPELRLAGVMMGAFQDVKPVQVLQTSSVAVSVSNLGISAVVPSYKLREILVSDPLRKMRTSQH